MPKASWDETALNSNIERNLALVRQELEKLEATVTEVRDLQPCSQRRDLYAAAFLLQSFYTGVETAIKRCLKIVGCPLPRGDDWHLELLRLAGEEKAGAYPAILSDKTRSQMNELRGFRHVARTHYGAELEPERLLPLLDVLTSAWTSVRKEIEAFLTFVESRAA